ncbi:hypothetical protein HYY69_00345 [Candidatus Woesearchaeota archaeon]|nr:hypothetical protein [Candidatus Woesearchaeota archaeon]
MTLEQLGASIAQPLQEVLSNFLQFVPGLIGAFVVLVVGYLVGWVVYFVLNRFFTAVKLDEMLIKKTNLSKRVGDLKFGHILAVVSKWYVFILFLTPAASLINLETMSEFLIMVSFWIPNLIAGVLIALIGLVAGDYTYSRIVETRAKDAELVAKIAQWVIIIFVFLIALEQVGLSISVARNTFLVVLAGLMLGVGIAVGISFGDAMKEPAGTFMRKHFKGRR